jgi:arsenate reductase
MTKKVLMLSYAGCSTCTKARKWLAARGVEATIREIVAEPPTLDELAVWIPRSKKPLRKWLNTSGQCYRALDKERLASMADEDVIALLANDGKLVKRPVLVVGRDVLVGFDEAAYANVFDGPA